MKNYYKSGEIVLVNFPYTNMVEFKVRPALIVRDQDGQDVIILGISSRVDLKRQDIPIQKNHYEQDPLPILSAIRLGKIATIEARLIVKRITRLQPEFFKHVQTALFRYLN